jgi:hypothetical protein
MLAAGSRLYGKSSRTLDVSTVASQGLHDFMIESQRHQWKDRQREVLQEIDNTHLQRDEETFLLGACLGVAG